MAGSIAGGMPRASRMEPSQSRVDRFISRVRLALVTSVRWAPPVRFHRHQLSTVPNSRSPPSALARAPSTASRSQASFGPEK